MVNNNASRPIELLSKDFNYTIGTQDNVQKIISNQLNIGNVSSSVNLKAPDYLEESYTLQLPERKGNNGQILTVTDDKLSWVEQLAPKVGPITNITYVHEDLKTHLKDDNDEHFPSEYAIKVNPTSPTCKLLVQFKLSYKTSIHIDNQINFIIEKSYINDDGDVILVRVSEEKLYGTPNATGGLISEYITNIIDTSETTKEITYKLGFKVDGEIYAEPLGILGHQDGYKNTIVIQELNEFHDTQFNGTLTYNDLNTTLSNAITAANNLFSERVEKLETEKLKVELINKNDIIKPYHPGNYTSVNVTKGALPVYDSNYQFSDVLVSMYTDGLHDNIQVEYENSISKNSRVYNINNIVSSSDEVSIVSPNNLMLSKRYSNFEFSFDFTIKEENVAIPSLMINIEPKDNSYECYYLGFFKMNEETYIRLFEETEEPNTNHGLVPGINYKIKAVKTANNLTIELIDGDKVTSFETGTENYSNSMYIGLLSNKNITIDNIVLNTEENNNNNPSVELVTNDDILTPLHNGNFTTTLVSQGALPIRNNKLIYVDSLVSLYTNGIDETFSIEFVNTTTKHGFVANIDNIITTLEEIDMLSNKNLMTTKKHGDFVYSCTFKLLEENKPVLSLIVDIEEDGNSYKYKYLDITNPNSGTMKTSANTPSNSTGFELDVEYELRIVKVTDTARVYVKNLKNYTDVHVGNISGLNDEIYLGLAHNKHLSVQNIKIESDLHLHPTPFPIWETLKEINTIKENYSLLETRLKELDAGKLDVSDIAHLAGSNVPVPLRDVPNAPVGFTPATPTKGYIPLQGALGGKQKQQLISLYSAGTDDKVDAELISRPLDNGTLAVVDIILSSSASDVPTVSKDNVSNLMTCGDVTASVKRGWTLSGVFKVFATDKSGPVLVHDMPDVDTQAYYQITGPSAVETGTPSAVNTLTPGIEYDFQMKKDYDEKRLYVKESTATAWSALVNDQIGGTGDEKHGNSNPIGLWANSNVVMRALTLGDNYESKRASYRAIAAQLEPTLAISDAGQYVFARNNKYTKYQEVYQLPKSGLWADAETNIVNSARWEGPRGTGFYNVPIDITKPNEYLNMYSGTSGIGIQDSWKYFGLLPSASIPQAVKDQLHPIHNASMIAGITAGTVIYFEFAGSSVPYGGDDTQANFVGIVLVDTATSDWLEYSCTLRTYTFDWTSLPHQGGVSMIVEHGAANDIYKREAYITSSSGSKALFVLSPDKTLTDFIDSPQSGGLA